MKEAVDLILQYRDQCEVNKKNPYLFPLTGKFNKTDDYDNINNYLTKTDET